MLQREREICDTCCWWDDQFHVEKSKGKGKKVKISLLQAMEAHRVARG
jgi:hypothetical protein